uniref:Uncharacterized protein n=1 Tax=Arundo donax TaxID=35708 RepID=A0A0A9BBQ9_ARUDO
MPSSLPILVVQVATVRASGMRWATRV